jgi:tetratricopeptide (TPR) repeat protein
LTDLWSLDEAWERLKLHIEWADRFWLVFVFTNDPRVVDELRRRVRSQLEATGRTVTDLRPTTADKAATNEMLEVLVEGRPDSVAWVDLVRHDRPGSSEWQDAWQYTCMQLNRRREVLRRQWAQGGIVLSTTLDRLASTSAIAPDLWTIRALLLRLAPLPLERSLPDIAQTRIEQLTSAPRVPTRDPNLARQAVLRARRALESAPSDEALANLAQALDIYATSLQHAGLQQPALAPAREAVDILRGLVQANPSTFLPHLASSLRHLGDLLHLGHPAEALAATHEAADILRDLARANPSAFLRDLANVLSMRGNRLHLLGRLDEALTATRESVDILHDLVQTNPDACSDLASALNHLGLVLHSLGRVEEGLAATHEAVEHLRKLAKSKPETLLPDLARTLANRGLHLHMVGRSDEALASALEAIDIQRDLARADPDAFLPTLSAHLFILGTIQHGAGQLSSAHDAYCEGLRALLPHLVKSPGAHAPTASMLALGLIGLHQRGVPIPETLAPSVTHLVELIASGPPPWSEAELERVSQLVRRDLQSS